MTTVVLGSHTFTAGPAVSKRMALNYTEIEIPDGVNAVHYMGRQNKEITFHANEVSKIDITDLYTAYAAEADATLSVPDFESGTCRIISLDQRETPGKPIQTYYEADITVAMIDAIPPSATPPIPIGTTEIIASFGNLKFPINPQNMSRAYARAVAKKSILGSGQTLESKQVGLIHITLDGVLAGPGAVAAMNCLETLWYNAEVKTLITPTYYTGEDALLVSLSFDIEQMKYYERRINFTAEFVLVPSARYKKPAWRVEIMNDEDEFQDAVGLMSINVERQYGGQASSFTLELDNKAGQNAYPVLDSGRDVMIYLGYLDSDGVTRTVKRIWGRIDTIDYSTSKQEGNTVAVAGRCYMGKLMEGAHLGPLGSGLTYFDWYPYDMMLDILTNPPTGINTSGLGQPYWPYWISGNQFPSFLTFHDEEKLEAVQKISEIYNMRFFMDSGELAGSPALIWETIPIPGSSPDVILNTKEWGQDIISVQARLNGIPARTKYYVIGDGTYSIADTESPTMIPSGNPNPAYAPGSRMKYGLKSEIVEENSLKDQIYCEVLAYSSLYKTELPDLEIRMTILGDQNLFPAMMVAYADLGYTGLAANYFLVSIVDNVSVDNGYTSELVLRRYSQVMSPTILSSLFKDISRAATGGKITNSLIGTVHSGTTPTHAITITLGSTGGTADPPPGTYHPLTSTYAVTAFAETGKYHYWILDGTTFSRDNPIVVNMNADHSLALYFMDTIPRALKLICLSGGDVSPITSLYVFSNGATQTVVATPHSGFHFDAWALDGVDVSTSSTYIVTMNADHILTARFALDHAYYTLSNAKVLGGHAEIYGKNVSGQPVNFLPGQGISVIAIPDALYSFVRWTFEDGSVSTQNPVTFYMNKDHTLTPTWVHT